MKNTKSKKSMFNKELPVWIAIVSALILGYLVYAVNVYNNDNRSSASEAVEEGVVLPVASDRE